MLEGIHKYDYLGTPDFFYDAIWLLTTSDLEWSRSELAHYFTGRIYDYPYIDGGVDLLLALGLITEDARRIRLALPDGFVAESTAKVTDLVGSRFFTGLMSSGELSELFNPAFISVEPRSGKLVISPQSFKLRYGCIKRLMLDVAAISYDEALSGYVVAAPYIDSVKTLIKKKGGRKVSIEQLKASLLRQEANGAEAEEFVVVYETKRLTGHPHPERIARISDVDVSAGYDIISFDSSSSVSNDRFIEVKSYAGEPSFYWSQNEIETAKAKGDSYYLYLVDRTKIADEGYHPQIVRNPYAMIYLADDWAKKPTVIFVSAIE